MATEYLPQNEIDVERADEEEKKRLKQVEWIPKIIRAFNRGFSSGDRDDEFDNTIDLWKDIVDDWEKEDLKSQSKLTPSQVHTQMLQKALNFANDGVGWVGGFEKDGSPHEYLGDALNASDRTDSLNA
jgi:hypothetical protein